MVQHTGGIYCLKSEVLVIEMTNEQAFGCERIWLNVDICSADALQEARLAHIWMAAHQKGSGVRIDRGKTTKMLTDLVEVEKGILQSLANGGHTTERGTLELLALKQRLSIFE